MLTKALTDYFLSLIHILTVNFEGMCTNPYISLFFHDGRVDVLDSDEEYVDYICYQEDFETDDELIREVAEFAGCANKCKTDAETAEFLKYQFGVIPIQNADIPALSLSLIHILIDSGRFAQTILEM